jgi:hypothetical protein
LTRPEVVAGPIERNRIPENVPVDKGSGFGVGVAAGVGEGVGVTVGGSVFSFESCWESEFWLKVKEIQTKSNKIRNRRINETPFYFDLFDKKAGRLNYVCKLDCWQANIVKFSNYFLTTMLIINLSRGERI